MYRFTAALLFLSSCQADGEGQTLGTLENDLCETTSEAVASDDNSLGFTAEELVTQMRAQAPDTVYWTDQTQGEAQATLSWTLEGLDDELTIVERGAAVIASEGEGMSCLDQPALSLPIDFALTLSAGAVVATGTLTTLAPTLSVDQIYVSMPGAVSSVATLSSPYAEQLDRFVAAGDYADLEVETVWFSTFGRWDQAQVALEVGYQDGPLQVAWRGDWSRAAE